MKAFFIIALLIGSNAYAQRMPEHLLKQQASAAIALAFPDAKITRICELGLSKDDAPAHVGIIISSAFEDNTPLTVVLYKTVSVAGVQQTANIRGYPSETLADRAALLSESAATLGAAKLTMGTCYNM